MRQRSGYNSNELQRNREFVSLLAANLKQLIPLNESSPEFAKVGTNVGKVEKRGVEMSSGATQNPKLLN